MSGYGVHQPLLSQWIVVEVPGKPGRTEGRNIARCSCGWRGPWREKAWKAGRDMRDHVEANRPKT